jgi:PAS domain S-box-containing protein
MKTRLDEIEPQLKWKTEQERGLQYGTIAYQGKMTGADQLLTYQQVPNTDWYLCTIVPLVEAYDLTQKATILSAVEIVLLVLGGLAFVTLLGVGGSALVLLVFSQNFKTTVRKQREEISGINENLKWNITKRKEVETYYQTLFNVANDAILLSNKFYLIECNNRAKEMFGGGRDEVLGRSILDLSPQYQPDGHDSNTKLTSVIDNSEAGELQFFVWTFRRLDGTDFPTEVGLNVFNLHGEELILYSIRDISKRVNAEEQLRQAQKMAAMGEMLGAIAHQWRQPLNTLSTYIASVQSAYLNNLVTAEFIERMAAGADSQIQFMSKTIDDFRHFFRPTKQKSPFDLVATINSSVKLVQPHLEQNQITLSVSQLNGDSQLIVDGYQSEFVHVLINILNNAMDSINEEKTSDRQIEVTIETGEGIVEVRVQDSGGGIPERLLPKIFDPYVTTKGTTSGTGLGLYMAKSIVENEMKGLLSAENTAVGSLFTIQLPYSSL